MDKNILSISEAASLLGVSDETLRNWERDGKLTPFHTEGGHRRYYKTDIEKLAGTYIEPVKVSAGNRVGINLYSDDGELQDSSAKPFIDWKRDSALEIEQKLLERTLNSLKENPPLFAVPSNQDYYPVEFSLKDKTPFIAKNKTKEEPESNIYLQNWTPEMLRYVADELEKMIQKTS